MKQTFKTLSVLSIILGLSATAANAVENFTSANDAVYRGHNQGFHGFEYNKTKLLVSKPMTNLDPGSKNFPQFGEAVNYALKQKMTLRANLSCANAPCGVKVVQGTQVIQGPVNVAFNQSDLATISNAMKTARSNEDARGEGRRQQRRDGAPIPPESR